MQEQRPFHFTFKVDDLAITRKFYGEILGCTEGRSNDEWVDFDFFGNQISAHVSKDKPKLDYCGHVDKISVPIPHFGAVITWAKFQEIKEAFEKENFEFIVPPQIRYPGQTGEQYTMFVLDYSGNPLEFKAYKDESEVFKKQEPT